LSQPVLFERRRSRLPQREKTPFFFYILTLSAVFLFLVFLPYIGIIVVAIVFAAVLYPVYERVLYLLNGRRSAAALLTVAMFIAVVLIPLVIIGAVVINDVSVWVYNIPHYLDSQPAGLKKMFYYTEKYLHMPEEAIRQHVMGQATNIEIFLIGISAAFMGNTIKIAAGIMVFLMSIFCFLRDGSVMAGLLVRTFPMPPHQTERIMKRLNGVGRSVVKGMLLNSLAVAFISFPGFYFTGLPVGFWCLAAATGILIPVIGSLTVWTSAAVVMLLTSGIKPALFIACYGAAVIGVCDNILGPYLMKGAEEISPIWILFSVLGGIHFLGISGIIVGPLILAMALAFVEVYRDEIATGKKGIPDIAKKNPV
jgi:predicted PurR-regulated permease PerM